MLIYATELLLSNPNGHGIAWETVQHWAHGTCLRHLPASSEEIVTRQTWDEIHLPLDGSATWPGDTRTRWCRTQNRLIFELSCRDFQIVTRRWNYVIAIEDQGKRGLKTNVTVRVDDVSPAWRKTPLRVQRPEIVIELLEKVNLSKRAIGYEHEPTHITKLPGLLKEITNPNRHYAIVICSPNHPSPYQAGDNRAYPIRPEKLQKELAGLAKVVYIPEHRLTYEVTDILGAEWSCYKGGTRIIMPERLNSNGEKIIPTKLILEWEIQDKIRHNHNPEEFFLFLIGSELNRKIEARTPTADSIRSEHVHEAAEALKKKLQEHQLATQEPTEWAKREQEISAMLELFENENRTLQEQLSRSRSQHDSALLLNGEKDAEIEKLHNELTALKERLRHVGTSKITPEIKVQAPAPRSLRDIPDFIEREYPDALFFTKHARKTLNDSPYENVSQVVDAFKLLATTYVETHRNGTTAGSDVFRKGSAAIGWEYSPHLAQTTRSEDFNCQYKGRAADMQRHLIRGSTRDPKYCFRLHYEYDPEGKFIVVHHAGRHPRF